jgi:hypothetical protein
MDTSETGGLSNHEQPSVNNEVARFCALPLRDTWWQWLLIYGLYLAATVALTWPVAGRIGRDLPGGGPGDPQMYLWNLWWLKFSLLSLHQNPLWCSWVTWPLGCGFAFNTHTILYSAIGTLLSLIGINFAASISLLFLNSFALTGLGTYLWCREFGAGRRAAFVGGFVVAFCIYRLARGLCHYNLLATEWLPFFWLAFKRGFEGGRWQTFSWAGVFLLLSFWQDVQLFIFALMFAAVYFVAAVVTTPKRLAAPRVWRGLAAMAFVFLLGSLPYWIAVVPQLAAGDYAVRENSPALAADVLSVLIPWPHQWLLGGRTWPAYLKFNVTEIESAYIGYMALVLASIGFGVSRARKRGIAWLAVAGLVFFVLSFGETLQIAGQSKFRLFGHTYSIVLPGALFAHIPVLQQFRVFSRFIFLAVFALAVPVALAVDWLEARALSGFLRRQPHMTQAIAPAIVALVALEIASVPYMTHPYILMKYAPFRLLERIRQDPEISTVFTVPPAIQQPNEIYYQMIHQKPIYGGNLGRRPEYLWRRYYAMPGVGNFFWERQEFLDPDQAAQELSRDFLDRFIGMHNIKYMVMGPMPKGPIVRQLIDAHFPIVTRWRDGSFVLCELARPPADRPLSIDLSQSWGILYVGPGFQPPSSVGSWATRRRADLTLPIRGASWKALDIEMAPVVVKGATSQTVELSLNGRSLGRVALEPQLRSYQFAIPPEALDDRPCSTLRFEFGYCIAPGKKRRSRRTEPLAAYVRQLHVLDAPREDLPVIGR